MEWNLQDALLTSCSAGQEVPSAFWKSVAHSKQDHRKALPRCPFQYKLSPLWGCGSQSASSCQLCLKFSLPRAACLWDPMRPVGIKAGPSWTILMDPAGSQDPHRALKPYGFQLSAFLVVKAERGVFKWLCLAEKVNKAMFPPAETERLVPHTGK